MQVRDFPVSPSPMVCFGAHLALDTWLATHAEGIDVAMTRATQRLAILTS